jgi:hypothetical protein
MRDYRCVKSPLVFVSDSHHDQKVLKRLAVHLKPLIWAGKVESWNDTRIRPRGNDGEAKSGPLPKW